MNLARTGVLLAIAVAIAGALSCVPASEPRPPAGAGGFRTEPSAATRGEPFDGGGGWRVTVEKLVVRMGVDIAPGDDAIASSGSSGESYYEAESYIFDARSPQVVFAAGVRVGRAKVSGHVRVAYFYEGDNDEDHAQVAGVAEPDLSRMGRPAEYLPIDYFSGLSTYGPSMLLRVRGERDGRSVVLDVTMAVDFGIVSDGTADAGLSSRYSGEPVLLDIRANALTTGTLTIDASKMFGQGIDFASLAAADADGDGILTVAELTAERQAPPSSSGFTPNRDDGTKLGKLAGRLRSMFSTRAP